MNQKVLKQKHLLVKLLHKSLMVFKEEFQLVKTVNCAGQESKHVNQLNYSDFN
jgi:hypothetical protein